MYIALYISHKIKSLFAGQKHTLSKQSVGTVQINIEIKIIGVYATLVQTWEFRSTLSRTKMV